MSEEEKLIAIHNAIHDISVTKVTIDGKDYPIKVNPGNLCRCVEMYDITYMEQNAYKATSKYAFMAQNGHKITWGIRGGPWQLVVDGKIERI